MSGTPLIFLGVSFLALDLAAHCTYLLRLDAIQNCIAQYTIMIYLVDTSTLLSACIFTLEPPSQKK